MSRGKKRPMRKKQINLLSMEISNRKYMRNHSLYGDEFRRQERIANLFKRSPRQYRKEGTFISR